MWKTVGRSVIGTSHQNGGLPCQDSSGYLRCELAGEPVLVIVVSDGAGSAVKSHIGSREAVSTLLNQAASSKRVVSEISREEVQMWFSAALAQLNLIAEREAIEVKDLACTALLAVLSKNHSIFAQIGDGAWVVEIDGIFGAATWPDAGQFANETTFLTSPRAIEGIQIERCSRTPTAVAGFTDGIQSLALNIASRSVHAPFFRPMFDALNECEDETSLLAPLISFLSSDQVNQRTDDDKTLALATYTPAQETADEVH